MDADLKHLVRAIEQAFGVCFLPGQLPDDPTPGDIHKALQSHFKTKTLGVSLPAIAFWRLRAAIVRQWGIPKSSITPGAALDLILPEKRRRKHWHLLADGAQPRLPRLGYSENAQLAILIAAALASLFVNEMLGGGWWSLSMVITFPFITSGLSRLCTWRADQVPEHVVTCGDLARLTAALNAGALAAELGAELGAPRDCELEELLHQVIHNYLGQEPKDLCAWNPPLSQLLDWQ